MKDTVKCILGHIVDPVNKKIFDGEITVSGGRIAEIRSAQVSAGVSYIMPGFVDSHVHIESSMMLPAEFARICLRHGTVAAVCDPHEIANVLGEDGIELMLDNARSVPFHFAFGVPSCVPSCGGEIETCGCVLDSKTVARLLKRSEFRHLSEMMNYPGVLGGDPEVLAKLEAAREAGKPVDGHAPGLTGESRRAYARAGISTDHECSTLEEGRDAIAAGMKILIREGSAAKNFEALSPLIAEAPGRVMLCTDDSHPTDIIGGHINRLVKRALAAGYPLMDVLTAACVAPVRHYNLPVGLLQEGDSADFICVSDLTPEMRILGTCIAGEMLEDLQTPCFEVLPLHNICNAAPVSADDLKVSPAAARHIITVTDGSLLTGDEPFAEGADIQKIVCYNRYTPGARPVAAYIRGFGMKRGAFAQTIAHDCHNIVAVGTDDALLADVINRLIAMKGGIVATDGTRTDQLQLPVAGLISPLPVEDLAQKNRELEEVVRVSGCSMNAPFITLGFMSLPVIPALKLTDRGLFDSASMGFVS